MWGLKMRSILYFFLLSFSSLSISEKSSDDPDTRFGESIAAEGNYLVVGAPHMNNSKGRVFVYDFRGGEINFPEELIFRPNQHTDDGEAKYGTRVAISENTEFIVVNDYLIDGAHSGGVYIFKQDPVQQNILTNWRNWSLRDVGGAPGASYCGNALDVSNFIVSVGCTDQPGRVGVFEKNYGGQYAWGERIQLMSNNPTYVLDNPGIGYSNQVSVSGNWLAVAENCIPSAGNNTCQGAIYLHEKDEGGNNKWEPASVLTINSPDIPTFDRQAVKFSLSLRGNRLVVGRSSADYGDASVLVYKLDRRNRWRLEDELEMPGPNSGVQHSFGYNVVIADNDRIIVSARGTFPQRPAEVSIGVIYKLQDNNWVVDDILFPSTKDINLTVASTGDFVFFGDYATGVVIPFFNDSGNWVEWAPISPP